MSAPDGPNLDYELPQFGILDIDSELLFIHVHLKGTSCSDLFSGCLD